MCAARVRVVFDGYGDSRDLHVLTHSSPTRRSSELFRWGEWRHKQYIDLPRFDGYRSLPGAPDGIGGGKRALVDRVRFSVIPDGSAAAAALVRGSLDVLDALAPNELAKDRKSTRLNSSH